MKISVIGLGWFGLPLARKLKDLGHEVRGTTRHAEKQAACEALGIHTEILVPTLSPSASLLDVDVVVLNVPPFPHQLDWFKRWNWKKESWMIFISSTSKSADLVLEESWARENFEKCTILRFGGLVGNGRHPGKHLAGKKDLSGRHWPVNLVHLDDCIGATLTVLHKDLRNQVFDIVSDEHATREEFYTEYAVRNGLPVPEFNEDLSEKEAVSNAAFKEHYVFKFPRMLGRSL